MCPHPSFTPGVPGASQASNPKAPPKLGESQPGGVIKHEGVRHLASLPQLETLLIAGTQITHVGLESLARVRSLRHLDIKGNKVSDEAVARLQAAIPGLNVVR